MMLTICYINYQSSDVQSHTAHDCNPWQVRQSRVQPAGLVFYRVAHQDLAMIDRQTHYLQTTQSVVYTGRFKKSDCF